MGWVAGVRAAEAIVVRRVCGAHGAYVVKGCAITPAILRDACKAEQVSPSPGALAHLFQLSRRRA